MKCLVLKLALALALQGLAPLAMAAPPKAEVPPLQGRVTQVRDGGTLEVTPPGQPPLLVALRNIEAPPLCQPGGAEARQALADLALNKPALVTPGRAGARGRVLAAVRVDEVDLSRRMVEEGFAWSTRSKWDRGPLVKEERMAKTLRRGLHGQGGMLSPTEFRRRHGGCSERP